MPTTSTNRKPGNANAKRAIPRTRQHYSGNYKEDARRESVQDNSYSGKTHNAKSSSRKLENTDKDGAREDSGDTRQPTTDDTNNRDIQITIQT